MSYGRHIMSDPKDIEANKIVRREFNKRQLDITLADLRVSHGVVYVRGVIKSLPGTSADAKTEVEHIVHLLKLRPEIRDVIIEAQIK